MIRILDIGMNHETAPVEVRECLSGPQDTVLKGLAAMMEIGCVNEAVFISTCNRVETVLTTENPEEAKSSVISMMSKLGKIEEELFSGNLYTLEDMIAVKHLFRVASSLDSMVIGEPQILGQIKEAYSLATRKKTSGVILNRLMHRAFHVAKRVRTETGICEAAVSISYAAVELAKKIFHVLEGKKVLLIGAGEMAELAAKHLKGHGVSSIAVANRTFERAVQLARSLKAQPVSFREIEAYLLEVDIVVASTAAPQYVIRQDQVRATLRKRRNRPLFFIDIAVPRDVQPQVNDLPNVYVYDIDDLKDVVALNKSQRRQEALKAEGIIEAEVVKFEKWLKTLSVVPTIISLRGKADSIVRAELEKSRPALRDLTPLQLEAVRILTQSVAEKILGDPVLYLKRRADRPSVNTYLDVTRKLFNLDEGNSNTE